MDEQGHVIGIDLGTTNSAAAVVEGGEPKIIPNAEGQTTTPSIVSFMDNGQLLVGESARRQAATHPQRTVGSAKRLIGRPYQEACEEENLYPFELRESEDGRTLIHIEDRDYKPEEISSMVLKKLKDAAEQYLGEEITQAVVTVPAYFDDMQRQATLEAAQLAGLNVMRLINEPTAAAMAYGLGQEDHQLVAVYDFGGGTFDFSLLELDSNTFEVLVSIGDSRLGGDDFDALLVDHLAERFLQDTGLDLRSDPMALRRLKDAAENAKRELSTTHETVVNLPFVTYQDGQPMHLESVISREEFEELIEPLVQESLQCCNRGLRQAKVRKGEIKKVLLVGGTTRIPLVQDYVDDFFGLQPFKGLNPDEIVACGAATQGAIMNGSLEEVVLLDVTPHTLGIETKGNHKSTIVEKNSTIPLKVCKTFTTTEDNQEFVNIHALQGDSEQAAECRSVGKFTLSGIAPAAAGIPRVRVTFFINADGVVEISAQDVQSGAEHSLTINHAYLSNSEHQARHVGHSRRRRRRRASTTGTDGSKKRETAASTSASGSRVRATHASDSSGSGLGQDVGHHADTDGRRNRIQLASTFAEVNDESSDTPPRKSARDHEPPASPVETAAPAEAHAQDTQIAKSQNAETAERIKADTEKGHGNARHNRPPAPVTLPKDLPEPLREIWVREAAADDDDAFKQACRQQQQAIIDYAQAHRDNAEVGHRAGELLIHAHAPQEARDVMNQLLERSSGNGRTLRDLYDLLCTNFPNFIAARRDRAQLALTEDDYVTAIKDMEMVAQHAESEESLQDELIEMYQKALQKQPTATMQFKLVKLHLKRRNLDPAIEMLHPLTENPDYRERATRLLGLCFWQKGMRYLAWQKLKQLPLDQELKKTLYRLALDMERNDELLHAQEAFERICSFDPDYEDLSERLRKLDYRLALQRDERYGEGGAGSANAAPEQSPDLFGNRFEPIEEINRGSMGIVYKAHDRILEEVVAIKVLNDFLCSDPAAVDRFKLEARSARRLTHPNIVRIHDLFEIGRKKIISMEYIKGEDLKTLMAERTPFDEDMVMTYLFQICEGLAYAHRLNVIHRDIKPANIMITNGRHVKITDFGIAKLLTETKNKTGTMVMGTPLYMAPEQIEGGQLDNRCDIYSLGIMLYEMVTGSPPFHDGNIEYQHIHSQVPEIQANLSDRLKRVILRCLEKKAEDRFATVEEILANLV